MKYCNPKYEIKYYKEIVKLKKKNQLSDFDLITNYGLFCGDTNLFKTLTIYNILMDIKKVKGDIIEFGVWNGNTSLLIKKILDLYEIKKKVYMLDHFKGLIHFSNEEKNTFTFNNQKINFQNKFISKKKTINDFINFFQFKNIKVIDKDARKLTKRSFKNKKFCLAIIDLDLYEPCKYALNSIENNITKGGVILFDEARNFEGERKAMNEFLKKNEDKYKKINIKFARQPDVMLVRK